MLVVKYLCLHSDLKFSVFFFSNIPFQVMSKDSYRYQYDSGILSYKVLLSQVWVGLCVRMCVWLSQYILDENL